MSILPADFLAFCLGGLLVLWPFTIGLGVYAFWRYAYTPFRVVRADQKALNDKVELEVTWLKNEIGLRKAMSMGDDDMAAAEMKMKARRLWPNPPSGVR